VWGVLFGGVLCWGGFFGGGGVGGGFGGCFFFPTHAQRTPWSLVVGIFFFFIFFFKEHATPTPQHKYPNPASNQMKKNLTKATPHPTLTPLCGRTFSPKKDACQPCRTICSSTPFFHSKSLKIPHPFFAFSHNGPFCFFFTDYGCCGLPNTNAGPPSPNFS